MRGLVTIPVLVASLMAAPVWAQTRPAPRPDGAGLPVQGPQGAPQPSEPARPLPAATPPEGLGDAIGWCWNTLGLSAEAMAVTITVAFENDETGRLLAETIEMIGFEGGSQAAAEEAFVPARRAILRCLQDGAGLDPARFEVWRRVEIRFAPPAGALR